MGTISTLDPNVAYNFQKVPGLVTSNKLQSEVGLAIALRNRPNLNRNVNFVFPNNFETPNYGAGSPTLLGVSSLQSVQDVPYAGRQLPL